jgi:hypothetical protein
LQISGGLVGGVQETTGTCQHGTKHVSN